MALKNKAALLTGAALALMSGSAWADEVVDVPKNRLYCSDPYVIEQVAKVVRKPDISALAVRRLVDDAVNRKVCFRARRVMTTRRMADQQDWVKLSLPSGAEVYMLHPTLYDSFGVLKTY